LIFDLDNEIYPPVENFKINDRVEFIYNNKSYYAIYSKNKKNNYYDIQYLKNKLSWKT